MAMIMVLYLKQCDIIRHMKMDEDDNSQQIACSKSVVLKNCKKSLITISKNGKFSKDAQPRISLNLNQTVPSNTYKIDYIA
jgi:alpha-galactosidase